MSSISISNQQQKYDAGRQNWLQLLETFFPFLEVIISKCSVGKGFIIRHQACLYNTRQLPVNY